MRQKHWSNKDKYAALELFRAGIPRKTIMAQLKMPERTLRRLIAADLKLWEGKMADSEYLEALVKSIPRRMVDVIERDGGMTKY